MTPMRYPRSVIAGASVALGLAIASATTAAAQTLPDLHPTAVQLEGGINYVKAGQTVRAHSCVENLGDQGTGVFNVAWYVDGTRQGYGSHRGVPGHSSVCNYNSAFTWTAPNDPGSDHTIKFVVDEDNFVQESDETNNSDTKPVGVLTP